MCLRVVQTGAVFLLTLGLSSFAADKTGVERERTTSHPKSGRFDPYDGADPGRYAPDRLVDYKHIRLDLTFDDLSSKSFSGTVTYTVRAVAGGVRTVRLNAVDLTIEAVRDGDGEALAHTYDRKRLVIRFAHDVPTDRDARFEVRYACTDPVEGMHFDIPDDDHPDRSPQVHTLGQPEFNRYWFPCHDFPNVRSTTELIATVPGGFKVLSNGRMVDERQDAGHVTYHWRQDQPHVAYLVTLVIGRFAVVADRWDDIPVTYWVPPGREADARRTFARTGDMLTFFSDLLGYDYPYDQYAQVCVRRFKIGGMEHTSATTMFDQILLDERAAIDHDQDGLISHEMAHQWFGDLITCRTWAHVWLNEGFATFFDELWFEHWRGRDRYLYDKWLNYQKVADAEATDGADALVWNRYERPTETFRHKDGLPYGKGSSLLHMLRHVLGDDVFFAGMRAYVRKYAYQAVETADFRRVMEAASGRSLEAFFAQWAFRPGVPRLDIAYTWDEESNTARVEVRQRRTIDANHPAFSTPLDLYFRSGGVEDRFTVRLRRRKEVFRRGFETRPELFCVDPEAGLLKCLRVTKPRPMWLTQLVDGPTVVARCEAARHLATTDRPEVVAALAGVVNSDDAFWGVRSEAARSLGVMRSVRARAALIEPLDGDALATAPKVRAAAAGALGQYDSREGTDVLIRLAGNDSSYAVMAAAIRGLGNASGSGVFERLRAGAGMDSYKDQVRVASAEALGALGDPRGVAVCEELASYGHHDRTRPAALEALGKLAGRGLERERIERLMLATLTDPERRARVGAVRGLGGLCGSAAYASLRAIAGNDPRGDLRAAADDAIDQMMEICEPEVAAGLLGGEVDALLGRLDRLSERVRSEAGALDIWATDDDDRSREPDE